MKSYGQHCPVAQAAEILNQRWTILIVRDLLYGARRFNEFRRFLPLISPTLLSQRLRHLERVGIVERQRDANGGTFEYIPTKAAEELLPIVEILGAWGQRWVRNRIKDDELDVSFLMHGVHDLLEPARLPSNQCVVEFHFRDEPPLTHENWRTDRWWLVVANGETELCLHDPERGVELLVTSDLRSLTNFFMGDLSLAEASRTGAIELHGDPIFTRTFDDWMPRSHFSHVPRQPNPIDIEALMRRSPAKIASSESV